MKNNHKGLEFFEQSSQGHDGGSGLNPASDLFQWEPNGNKRRSARVHIDINA